MLNSIDPRVLAMQLLHSAAIDMITNTFSEDCSHDLMRNGFQLSVEETARYLRVVSQSQAIRRHVDLFAWLKGEFQEFIPHEIFISAWGDFVELNLKLDIISALPGIRTEQLEHHRIDDIIRATYSRWITGGRRPIVLKTAEAFEATEIGSNPFYATLRAMKTMLVHGIRDERSGHESLYIAMNRGSFTKGRCKDRFLSLVDSLIPQIDIAFRRIAAYPLRNLTALRTRGRGTTGADARELSIREQEILGWLCQGKTNSDIAKALRISPFTVKNHVQRIFKKIGVTSRMQAATKYSAALSELRKYLESSQNVDQSEK
jgi:transcriptional regulator EpsA